MGGWLADVVHRKGRMQPIGLALIIDDDQHDNFFHERSLRRSRFVGKIEVRESADDGLAYLRDPANETPDLILLDINMPRKSGWDFLDEYALLPSERRAGALLVMLTSSDDPYDQRRAEGNGHVSGFVTKPLSPDAVVGILKAGNAIAPGVPGRSA